MMRFVRQVGPLSCQALKTLFGGVDFIPRTMGTHWKFWVDMTRGYASLHRQSVTIVFVYLGVGGRHGVGWDRVIHMVSSCAWICPLWPIFSLLGVEYQIPSKPIVLGSYNYKSIHITILPLLSCSLMFWYLASSVWPRWETSLLKQGPELPFLGWW